MSKVNPVAEAMREKGDGGVVVGISEHVEKRD